MEDGEICEKVERIVRETLPESEQDWITKNLDDITVKYKVQQNEDVFTLKILSLQFTSVTICHKI